MEFITNHIVALASSGAAALALLLLRKIPNEKIYSKVEAGCYMLGSTLTLGLSKWKFTKQLWNKTVEPYFVDLVDNTAGAAIQGFIKGLRSDD